MGASKPSKEQPKKRVGIRRAASKKSERIGSQELARLKASEAEYRRLFEDSLLAISQASPDGRLLRTNATYAKMYGYASPEEMIAAVPDLERLYVQPEVRRDILRAIREKGSMGPREVQVYRRDGTPFSALVAAQAIKDPDGRILYYQATHLDISELKQAEEALRKSEAYLRALAFELSRTEERERRKLAAFLHDEISQGLVLLRWKLDAWGAALGAKPDAPEAKAVYEQLAALLDQTHALTFELSPPILHQLGLAAAIQWAGAKIRRDYGLDVAIDHDGQEMQADPDLLAMVFRCIRELMLNAARHAKARLLKVAVARKDGDILVTIADDGIGLDASQLDGRTAGSGFGLMSVREHLALLGGSCRIQSKPSRGTKIEIMVPIKAGTPE